MGKTLPLSGLTVVVTRDRAQSGKLADALEAEGAAVIAFPVVEISPSDAPPPFHAHTHFDWTLFTSVNAVHYFAQRVAEAGWSPTELDLGRIGCVGPATHDAARAIGLDAEPPPEQHDADALYELVAASDPELTSHRVLLPRANIARDTLLFNLRSAGATTTPWTVYTNSPTRHDSSKIDTLVNARPDVVTFTSASTAANFAKILGPDRLKNMKRDTVFVSIGPQTTEAAEAADMQIAWEADPHTIPGMIEAIKNWQAG